MKVLRILLVVVVSAACAIAADRYVDQHPELWPWSKGGPELNGEPPADEDLVVHAPGRLAPADGVITIATAPGEQIEELPVHEGQCVKVDQLLGTLTSYEVGNDQIALLEIEKKVAVAKQEADKSLAMARARQAELVVRQAREQKDEDLQIRKQQTLLLQNKHELAVSQFDKLKQLHESDPDLVNAAELEKQRLLTEQARLEHEQAELALKLAPQTAERAIESAEADQAAADAAVEQLQSTAAIDALDGQIAVAQKQNKVRQLRAPVPGTVLKVYCHKGDIVTQQPIMQIANLDNMACVAEVYESQVKLIEQHQAVRIESPAFSEPYDKRGLTGIVKRIGNRVTSPGLISPNPLAPSAKHIVEVEIEITDDSANQEEKDAFDKSSRLVDLQVNVVFIKEKGESQD